MFDKFIHFKYIFRLYYNKQEHILGKCIKKMYLFFQCVIYRSFPLIVKTIICKMQFINKPLVYFPIALSEK